jgi:hypothetical protein
MAELCKERSYLIEQCRSSCFCLLQETFRLVQKLRKFSSNKDECRQVPLPRRGQTGMVTDTLKENMNIPQLLVLNDDRRERVLTITDT